MKNRYRPGVESLEPKLTLSANFGAHQIAALRAAHRLNPKLNPSHFLLEGTVVGFMKVEPGMFSTEPGPVGARNFVILRSRGHISELGAVRATGSISENHVTHGPASWNPFGGPDQLQNFAEGMISLKNSRGTEVDLPVSGPDVPPGTAFTNGPNYLSPGYLAVNQDYAHHQKTVGVVNLSFPRGQPFAHSGPRLFVMNFLVASQPTTPSPTS